MQHGVVTGVDNGGDLGWVDRVAEPAQKSCRADSTGNNGDGRACWPGRLLGGLLGGLPGGLLGGHDAAPLTMSMYSWVSWSAVLAQEKRSRLRCP